MHILILSTRNCYDDSGTWGGIHTHLKNLIELVVEKGHDVSLITGYGKRIENGSLNVIPVHTGKDAEENKKWFRAAGRALLRCDAKKKVDCLFSEGGAARGLMGLTDELGIPVVAFMHLLHMHYFYNIWHEVDGLPAFKSFIFRSVPRFIYGIFRLDIPFLRNCKKVVTGSCTIAEQIERFYRIPKEKIIVVHNWVEPDKFKNITTNQSTLRMQMGLKEDEIVYLLLGALTRKKGFRICLKAFQKIAQKLPNSHLLIAGEGPDRPYFEQYIKSSGYLKQRVTLLGLYPHEKLPSLFSSSDIFVIPSLMNEVLPYTLLEAMSCNLPIIATNITANREALGDTGYFVPRSNVRALEQAMLSFASDLTNQKVVAEIHGKRVKNYFSRDVASRKINQLITDVLG